MTPTNDAEKALERLSDIKYPLSNAKRCLHMKALMHSDKEDGGKEPQFVRISMQEYYDIANCIQFLDARSETIRTALAKSAKVDGLLEAMKMVMDELKEINLSNYNHDDVYSLNSSSVAGYLLLEEAIQRFNGEA